MIIDSYVFTGLSGPILWLQNSLNRTADDREEDGENIPVFLFCMMLVTFQQNLPFLESKWVIGM